jgi:hypothetical protein
LPPVQAACDAAHAEVARQKWLALELERQSTRADAAVRQVELLEADKAALSAELDKVQVGVDCCFVRRRRVVQFVRRHKSWAAPSVTLQWEGSNEGSSVLAGKTQ